MATTKLLLLEDVEALGRSGDVVNVRKGYARNFLLPKRHAIVANKQALRRQKQLQEERAQKAAEDRKDAEAVAQALADVIVTVHVKVDHEGHMYGSVSALDVVRLVEEQVGVKLNKNNVFLKHSIKTTGVHDVKLKLPEGVEAAVTVKVLSEEVSAKEVIAKEVEEGPQSVEVPKDKECL